MNETGRRVREQYADTGGFTDHVFAMRASTRRRPRPEGVSAGIRPMASSAIRNQTWSPPGSTGWARAAANYPP